MPSKSYNVSTQVREYKFPFRVLSVYYCWDWTPYSYVTSIISDERVEIAIRLRSASGNRCMDKIDDKICNIDFPHVLIKRPGVRVTPTQLEPRDTISFQYPSSYLEKFRAMDLLPDHDLWKFQITPRIESLLSDFQHCLYTFYTAGVPDELDWICFKLLWELSHNKIEQTENENTIIKNSSLYLQLHFHEKISVEDLAKRCGMSRAAFYIHWKNNFDISPIQYVLELRLQSAAELLKNTQLPISQIADEVGFCSVDSFHRKFKAKFNMTPACYRKMNNHPEQ